MYAMSDNRYYVKLAGEAHALLGLFNQSHMNPRCVAPYWSGPLMEISHLVLSQILVVQAFEPFP